MSDGFYRIPCKNCKVPFIPVDEKKNVFCSSTCREAWYRSGNSSELLRFRAQLKQATEILNGDVNPPIPLPMNPGPCA